MSKYPFGSVAIVSFLYCFETSCYFEIKKKICVRVHAISDFISHTFILPMFQVTDHLEYDDRSPIIILPIQFALLLNKGRGLFERVGFSNSVSIYLLTLHFL